LQCLRIHGRHFRTSVPELGPQYATAS
jgi:hypothetical protein